MWPSVRTCEMGNVGWGNLCVPAALSSGPGVCSTWIMAYSAGQSLHCWTCTPTSVPPCPDSPHCSATRCAIASLHFSQLQECTRHPDQRAFGYSALFGKLKRDRLLLNPQDPASLPKAFPNPPYAVRVGHPPRGDMPFSGYWPWCITIHGYLSACSARFWTAWGLRLSLSVLNPQHLSLSLHQFMCLSLLGAPHTPCVCPHPFSWPPLLSLSLSPPPSICLSLPPQPALSPPSLLIHRNPPSLPLLIPSPSLYHIPLHLSALVSQN